MILKTKQSKKKVLILGVNGFIGNALSQRLLQEDNYDVYGLDLYNYKLSNCMTNPRFHFKEGDISIMKEWVEYHIKKCDIVIPLVAIATPKTYVEKPLKVFKLDFEENLRIVKMCSKYKKRIIFPSTSEVYAMCDDETFNENTSNLITGPIEKIRWIYSCSKQMLDRVIWAYGLEKKLDFTLFRPFNWIGPKLDDVYSAKRGNSRVLSQFIYNLIYGLPIKLVDGGEQLRAFTDIKDGVEALYKIILNENGLTSGKIFNIGNPDNLISIKGLAELLVDEFKRHPKFNDYFSEPKIINESSSIYYGAGYQDVTRRTPSIENAEKYLNWKPKIELQESISRTLNYYIEQYIRSNEKEKCAIG